MKPSLASQLVRQLLRHPHYMRGLLANKIKLYRRHRWVSRNEGKEGSVPPPLVYKLVLTHKCNLQCKMCYQWGQSGWCRSECSKGQDELDWPVVEKLFAELGTTHPQVILIGGEPLLYSRFRDLAALLQKHKCHTIICTNGLLLDRFEDVFKSNPYLSVMVSLDGVKDTNDSIRGTGVYEKVLKNIHCLQQLRRPPYIGAQFTIRPENVEQMHQFCSEMSQQQIDWVLLNLFWFITDDQARDYENFMSEQYRTKAYKHLGFKLPYPIDPDVFIDQYRLILQEYFPMQVSCYLKDPEDIHAYLKHPEELVRYRRCFKQWVRIDITPAGEVSPCIQFPDLVFGNVHKNSVLDIWNNEQFKQFRKNARARTHPLCSKCNCIYLYEQGRKYL
jgi:MoaA/NifB/PqqE/SkfB family radical SAM enzyme